ncbi:hypothetical protein CYMTET_2623 [Cymbomonas tetramitiformis]|uniref:Uncharacterized protein n=1 Tax=Cymbomonas tetramitiformis TaxID=36881 RepID=A0AAE0H4W4_9CHLO|nr:hypothetical protein CYMTET_2623 [Cymbomonas tetramitiformis]
MRRSALRDRLRRSDVATVPLDLEDDGRMRVPTSRPQYNNASSLSLSPPKERPAESGHASRLGVVQLGGRRGRPQGADLSSVLATSSLFKGVTLGEDDEQDTAKGDDMTDHKMSEELVDWKSRVGREDGNLRGYKPASSIYSVSSLGRTSQGDDSGSDDDDASIISHMSGASRASSAGGRYPVSERASKYYHAYESRPYQTGAVQAEFICTSLGIFVLLAFVYCVQYAARFGYITPYIHGLST